MSRPSAPSPADPDPADLASGPSHPASAQPAAATDGPLPLPDRAPHRPWRAVWLPLAAGAAEPDGPAAMLDEMPVAIAVNTEPYAVMMVTPGDLADFARGFALAEGLIDGPDDLLDVCLSGYREPAAEGVSAHLTVRQACLDRLATRRRATVGTVACGLCGTADIAGALRPLPPVATPIVPTEAALSRLSGHLAGGALGRATRAAHAALIVDAAGTPIVLREDAGRHTALDKAIGAWADRGRPTPALAALTSRCSVELVQKAATAGLSALVTIGAPTALAVDTAKAVGLPLIVRLRADGGWRAA